VIGVYLMYALDDCLRFRGSLDVIDNMNPPDYEHAFFDFDLASHIGG
jgi:hypothetical protein